MSGTSSCYIWPTTPKIYYWFITVKIVRPHKSISASAPRSTLQWSVRSAEKRAPKLFRQPKKAFVTATLLWGKSAASKSMMTLGSTSTTPIGIHVHPIAHPPLFAKIARKKREGNQWLLLPFSLSISAMLIWVHCSWKGKREGEMEIECMCEMGNDADCARDICQGWAKHGSSGCLYPLNAVRFCDLTCFMQRRPTFSFWNRPLFLSRKQK